MLKGQLVWTQKGRRDTSGMMEPFIDPTHSANCCLVATALPKRSNAYNTLYYCSTESLLEPAHFKFSIASRQSKGSSARR